MAMQKKNRLIIYIDNGIDTEPIPKKLLSNISENNFICVPSNKLLPNAFIENNSAIISMIIMDWSLWSENDDVVEMSDKEALQYKVKIENLEKGNVEFIRLCVEYNIPVVIFTRFSIDAIESKLIRYKFIKKSIEEQPLLLITTKKDNISNIWEEWYSHLPSIHIFDIAREILQDAEKEFFSELIATNNSWIKSLWDSFCVEKEFMQENGREYNINNFSLIYKDYMAKIISCIVNRINVTDQKLDKEFLNTINAVSCTKQDAKKIIERIKYIENNKIDKKSIRPGDLFKCSGTYYINVRAECDTARGDKPILYLLKGKKINEEKFLNEDVCSICQDMHDKPYRFLGKHFELIYNDRNFTIPYVDNGNIVQFSFNNLKLAEYSSNDNVIIIDGKNVKRIGRVLPPYSIKIQQRFTQYMCRVGLDALPKIIMG